jgi:ectoine hydroxylase-related dioxygenase (phytanoyl-CoA dioxygenase family)
VNLRDAFRERGFVVARGILSPEAVEAYTVDLERISERTRASFAPTTLRARLANRFFGRAWTLPDGVTKRREFWPLVLNPALLGVVRDVLGDGVRYLQHSDLHVGFSAVTFHRDSVNRSYGTGPDWDESVEPYRLVRVGLYLQRFNESGFALGLVPGSQRLVDGRRDPAQAALEEKTGYLSQAAALLTGRNPLRARAEWVGAESGDAILFDPRILHAGSFIRGPKYSIFLAFGVPGAHFERHRHYYRVVRRELFYEELPEELSLELGVAGLRAEAPPVGQAEPVGFKPSAFESLLGRRVRPRT